jgi:NADH-quinone oxidoreductase subunit D
METVASRSTGDFYTRRFAVDQLVEKTEGETLILNIGPQHPATHGVLRLVVEMDGEYIRRCEPVLGYIHRMHEKMAENRTYTQYLPNMGRVDYLHALAWNWAYVGAVERLMGIEVPRRAEIIRIITCELNRISSHLVWTGAYLLDLGAFTPILYTFADRERILDILQIVTGSRLTYCYYRFGGVSVDITPDFLKMIREFIAYFRPRLPMYRDLVTDNIILRGRCEDIGVLPVETARSYGATGPVLRGSGVAYDVRRAEPYSLYDQIAFEIPVGTAGDAMDRYRVRMAEIEQSLAIIEQAMDMISDGPILSKDVPERIIPPRGETYFAVEGARGKIGIYLLSDGSAIPYRVKLRAPGFSNLHVFAELSIGCLLADALSILGSLDLVIPEIDR